MDKTYGMDVTDFRIQLMQFTAKYLDEITGLTDAAKGMIGLMLGNIIRGNRYDETTRIKIQMYASEHGYSFQQLDRIISDGFFAWRVHVEMFKNNR